jgi:regulator of cell morphogenesis and NO signaling
MLESWAMLVDPNPRSIPSPVARGPAELIPVIVSRFHDVHREDFPKAIRLARAVELCSGRRVADHLAMMFDELEAHQQREERILFPAMLNGGCAAMQIPMRRMMAEHDDVLRQLETLEECLGAYEIPAGAPPSWAELVELSRKIDRDLREHMRIENEELFAPFLNERPPGEARAA